MNEDINALEAELARMRPSGLPPALTDRLDATLSLPARSSWSDRLLLCAIGSGAIAACMIVLLLAGEPASRDLPMSVTASTHTPRAGDLSMASDRQPDVLASDWK